jgi:hypothetical protein
VSIVDYPKLLAVSDLDKARAVIEPPNRKIKWSVKGPNGTGDKVDPVIGKETTVKSGSRPGWLTLTAMDAETEACAVSVQIPVARLTILLPFGDPADPAGANDSNERVYDRQEVAELSVPCLAQLEPEDVKASVIWEIENIGNIRAIWQPTYPGLPNRGAGLVATAIFHGMPAHNRDFGFKDVRAYLLERPACSDGKRIEAFYSPLQTNNSGPLPEYPPPGIDPNDGLWSYSRASRPAHVVNWFLYGEDGKVAGNMDNMVGWLWATFSIWGKMRIASYYAGRIGVHNDGFLDKGDDQFNAGQFQPPVIHCNMPGTFGSVSLCIIHEQFHRYVDLTFGPASKGYHIGPISDPFADTDGDGIPNYIEDPARYGSRPAAPHPVLGDISQYNLDPTQRDTYSTGTSDQELLARIATSLSAPQFDPEKDFSMEGFRWHH